MRKNNGAEEALVNATSGIIEATKKEKSIQREIAISILVLIISTIFKISGVEFIGVILSIGLVIVTELVNTAIEYVVDMNTGKFNQNAKKAKDIAAGAVVASLMFAGLVGFVVFKDRGLEAIRSVLNGEYTFENIVKSLFIILPGIYFSARLLVIALKRIEQTLPLILLSIIPILIVLEVDKYIVIVVSIILLVVSYIYLRYISNKKKFKINKKLEQEYRGNFKK